MICLLTSARMISRCNLGGNAVLILDRLATDSTAGTPEDNAYRFSYVEQRENCKNMRGKLTSIYCTNKRDRHVMPCEGYLPAAPSHLLLVILDEINLHILLPVVEATYTSGSTTYSPHIFYGTSTIRRLPSLNRIFASAFYHRAFALLQS